MRVAISHVTRLDLSSEVAESVMDARLGPRDDDDQRVQRFLMRLEPGGHIRRYEDGFGNVVHLFTNMRPHGFLQVTAESEVLTLLSDPFELPPHPPEPLDALECADALHPSPLVPRLELVQAMADPFRAGDPFDAVRRMTDMIYREYTYRQHVTDVTSSIEQVVDGRQGVCQDFAHLLIGLCRSMGVPARYVSGYIVTRPLDSDDQAPSRGEGASHAWVEAFTPTHGWRGFDPTNNLLANEHYVKVAVGRDYSDVPPTRGTYHGLTEEHLSVAVSTRVVS